MRHASWSYHETDSSLHDSEKNRLFEYEQHKSGRIAVEPSPWSEGDFAQKMVTLLRWANPLNRAVPAFREAQTVLENEDTILKWVVWHANQTSQARP